jgi:hypothetical protein
LISRRRIDDVSDISALPPLPQPTQDRRKYTRVTEELDNSLRQAIENYLNERLLAIDEQLSRLQTEFDEAFTRVRESSATKSIDETPLANAITAHLQAAREQKLSGVTANAQSAREVGVIRRSVAEIEQQQTHSDVLRVLLMSAVQFAERAALFVIRNEQAIGWQVCEARDATNLESIRGVALPLTAETLLGQVSRSRSAWTGATGSNAEDRSLIEQLGGSPQNLAAVPLIARGKVVAILYADTASPDSGSINMDALELLTRVAGMAVSLVATPPAVRQSPAIESVSARSVAPETVSEAEPGYVPQIEPQTSEVPAESVVEQAATEPEVAGAQPEMPVETAAVEPVVEEAADQSEAPTKALPEAHSAFDQERRVEESSTTETLVEAAPVEAEPPSQPAPAAAPDFASHYATPLGAARRYGVTEPELPIEVGEEERRLHNDARRFARLLVSEIKLYNEQKVKEGRSQGNIYDRLREDIDRSRQMYDKRVAPPVAARHDYFHQELVNTLAEGDPARLGANYPGAGVTVG